jgi:DNA-binding LacI/PurR family transcriptional regulator
VAESITTLSDVAARAGVSISTASRALNGLKVSKANAEKVRQAATHLGYVANEGARSLRSVRTMTMGVIFLDLNNPLGLELLEALTAGIEQRGYNLYISTARGQEDRYDLLVHRFLERRVDALFCINASGDGAALDRFAAAGIPVAALFHASGGYARLPLIGPTIEAAAKATIERLQELGHHRIGVVRPTLRWGPIETLLRLARDAGLTVRIYEPPEGPLDGVICLSTLMGDEDSPTAILGPQTAVVSLLEAADALHIMVPRDLSLVAIRDRTQQMPTTRLPLSMIHLNPDRVGKVAADLMCDRLAGGALEGPVLVEMGAWIERATTGPAKADASVPA